MILSTKSNVASTLLPFSATILPVSATMSNEISSFRQCQNKSNMFNLFRLCRKDEILQQNRSTLLPFVTTKSNVASTLLLVWTEPKTTSHADKDVVDWLEQTMKALASLNE